MGVSPGGKNIDFDAVWKAATVDVPLLLAQLRAFMPSDPP
jgi:hypothetical protein